MGWENRLRPVGAGEGVLYFEYGSGGSRFKLQKPGVEGKTKSASTTPLCNRERNDRTHCGRKGVNTVRCELNEQGVVASKSSSVACKGGSSGFDRVWGLDRCLQKNLQLGASHHPSFNLALAERHRSGIYT